MKTATTIAILSLCLIGCQPGVDANAASTDKNSPAAAIPKPSATAGQPQTGGSAGGVAPMAAGAGGMTPMSGTESVGGGGDGVGQAAKKMAKDKSANMGSGSLGQGEKDDSGQ